jgi:hypothetical protein
MGDAPSPHLAAKYFSRSARGPGISAGTGRALLIKTIPKSGKGRAIH